MEQRRWGSSGVQDDVGEGELQERRERKRCMIAWLIAILALALPQSPQDPGDLAREILGPDSYQKTLPGADSQLSGEGTKRWLATKR